MSGVITSANSELLSDGWELQGPVDSEAEVLHVSQKEKILASPAQFFDIVTGKAIPNDRVLFICQALDRIQRLLQEARDIYKKVMRETPGSRDERKMAARQASEAHAGGGYTQIWNRLSDEKICISIRVTAPPADTRQVAEQNELRLL